MSEAAPGEFGYARALLTLSQGTGDTLDQVLAAACAPASDPVVYLADFSRQALLPLTPGVRREEVEGTLPGRAFTTGQPVTAGRDGATRVWVPVVEHTTLTGVLAMTVPRVRVGKDTLAHAGQLGVFVGLVLAALDRVSDTPYVRRQGRDMSLPASMQWDLLPPWTTSVPGALIAGMLEPAYDIAGDAFDYAANDGLMHFAIIDAMGHGIGSTLLSGLTVGAYRHARRHGVPLVQTHVAIDEALDRYYRDASFATGIIGTLAISTGRLEWTCAGHPPPLLLRGRKVVAELEGEATLPFGLGSTSPWVGSRDLEPGDAVLLYTDGVVEARTPDGELFGQERLVDLLEREAAGEQPPEELLRRLVQAVLTHQAGGLRDDATLLLLQWTGL